MKSDKVGLILGTAVLVVANCRHAPVVASTNGQPMVTRCMKAEDVGIRLYYDPLVNGAGKAHRPCIFLPVSTQDSRLGQRPAWVLYVTLSDLRKELGLLAEQQYSWTDSPNPKQLIVDALDLKVPPRGGMEITATCPEGSAQTEVEPRRICGLLSNM